MILTDPLDVQLCKQSLGYFMRCGWHVVEPGRELLWNWHLDGLCLHLEAASRGFLREQLLTFPPGTTKSQTVDVFWPVWHWLTDPGYRFLFVSNAEPTATQTSNFCRRLVESDWFQQSFRPAWQLREDQNNKTWFENDSGGHRICFGINSNVTGRKGDAVIVNDANDARRVESAVERLRVNRSYDEGFWDRLINFQTGIRLIVGQRTHVDDLIGHTKRNRHWFELRIPEQYRPSRRYVSPVIDPATGKPWQDPRTKAGELLRPNMVNEKLIKELKRANRFAYKAKYQQEPESPEGIRFKAKWLLGADGKRRWRVDPDGEHIILSDHRGDYRFHPRTGALAVFGTADPAASAKTAADYSVFSGWILTERQDLLWASCRRFQAEIPDQPAILHEEYVKHQWQWCAVEAVFANRALLQHAQRLPMTIKSVDPGSKDKLARAVPAIVLAEQGQLWLPDEEWAELNGFPFDTVLDELTAFTGDEKQDDHDDIVDSLSYAVQARNDYYVRGGDSSPTTVPLPTAGAWAASFRPNPFGRR